MNKNETPLVTIYITNFNYGKYIKKAIESVLNQTLTSFELIIIDDGSQDQSLEIINEYKENSKIKIIKQINKGLNVSNNIALRLAKGKYIIRLDADDWLEKNALEELANVLNKYPKVGLVFADYYHVNKYGVVIERVKRHNFKNVNLLDQPAHGACTLIRTKILKSIGGYDEDFKCQDGFDLWIRFIQEFEVSNINKPLFFYRKHDTNLTSNEKKILSTRAKILDKVSKLKKNPLSILSVLSVRGRKYDSSCLAFEKLNEKFVIDWTIDAINKANKTNLLIIDTPDIEIFNYANSKNIKCILRDPKLAQLNTSIYPSIKNIVASIESNKNYKYDAIFQFTIDSPFRSQIYIDSAINIMSLFNTELVIGVREENDLLYQHNGNGLETIKANDELRLEREDLYKEVGSMRLIKRDYLFNKDKFPNPKIGHVKLDEKSSLRINTKLNWEIAKHIAKIDI